MNISIRLKELTQEVGITSKELSQKTGIPYDSLKNYEYGRREPTGRALVALETFFGVSGAYLCGKTNERNSFFSWQDDDIMDTVKSNLVTLMKSILKAVEFCSDFEQKMLFDILVELRHVVSIDESQQDKRRENLSYIQNTIARSNQLINFIEKSNNQT